MDKVLVKLVLPGKGDHDYFDDVLDWCENNCNGYWKFRGGGRVHPPMDIWTIRIELADADDQMLFKLVWGGELVEGI